MNVEISRVLILATTQVLEKEEEEESEQEEAEVAAEKRKKYEFIEDIPGVGPATAEKLKEMGFHTVESLATATVKELTQAGVGEKQAAKVIAEARDSLALSFIRADELMKMRQNVKRLSTGSKQLDELVGGGLETQTITEFYGEYGVGKCSAKDTPALYFNDEHAHLANLENIYARCLSVFDEERWSDGFRVPSLGFKTISLVDGELRKSDVPFLYREHVRKLVRIATKQGRNLRVTGAHRLLSVTDHGLEWMRAGDLRLGMSIGSPKTLDYPADDIISEDDAYFLGIYVAEGSWSGGVSNSNRRLVKWLGSYIWSHFGYKPTMSRDPAGWNVNLRKPTKEWLGSLHGTVASSKFVPETILHGSLRLVKSFLAGYVDGDGCFNKGRGLEITTKSEKLASQVAYLLLRLGAQSKLTSRIVRGERYYRLYVARNWAYKLNDLPYKICWPRIKPKCERRVYPASFAAFLRQLYRSTIGGGRGRRKKRFGTESANRVFRLVLTRNAPRARVSETVLMDIVRLFTEELRILKTAKAEAEKLSGSNFKKVDHLIPFSLNIIAEKSGVSKNALDRFQNRGLPRNPEVAQKISDSIVPEIGQRITRLEEGLRQIALIRLFDWDIISRSDTEDYNDYVYDLFVPEGNAYVGGNLPTLLHNSILCHQLAVNVQLPEEKGGLNGSALYIDTENTFRPEWIVRMANALGIDPVQTAKNIIYSEAFNSDHQILVLEKADKVIQENKVKLIIVDSLTSHFRSEYLGREMLAERQQKLNSHLHRLVRLSRAFNACAVVTNQVMSRPDQFFAMAVEAVGGHIVSHTSHTRLFLRRTATGPVRICRLISSPYLPEGERIFKITEEGIKDITEEDEVKRRR